MIPIARIIFQHLGIFATGTKKRGKVGGKWGKPLWHKDFSRIKERDGMYIFA
jgi:hypothetical protein